MAGSLIKYLNQIELNYVVHHVNIHLAKKGNWCCVKMANVSMLVKNVRLTPYFIDSKTFSPLTSLKLGCLRIDGESV